MRLAEIASESISIRVTPRASANRIKLEQDANGEMLVRVYVTCVPEDGRANAAVIQLLAKELGVAKSALVITHGETSRHKTIRILK